jgi:hypothetical protein
MVLAPTGKFAIGVAKVIENLANKLETDPIISQKGVSTMADPVVVDPAGLKAGWRTTEFWMTVFAILSSIVGTLTGIIPAELAVKITTICAAFYTVLRTLAKSPSITTLVSTTPK